jgi:hypothetical protein
MSRGGPLDIRELGSVPAQLALLGFVTRNPRKLDGALAKVVGGRLRRIGFSFITVCSLLFLI